MATSVPDSGKATAPLESKAQMDKDYDYYISKYNGQGHPPQPPRNGRYNGNLGVTPMEPVMEQVPMHAPPRPPTAITPPDNNKVDPEASSPEEKVDSDEALLDLAQLEELHHEAERMKALGNKHMAAQVS